MALTKLNFSGQPVLPSASIPNLTASQIPTLTASQMPTGTVLQTVEAYNNTSTPLTSGFTTILEPNITPSSTSSKIIIMATMNVDVFGDSSVTCRFKRDISGGSGEENLNPNYGQFMTGSGNFGSSNQHGQGYSIIAVDSPNTTSLTKYKLQMIEGGNAANVYANHSGHTSMFLMEIAG